jgi:hypothetical protein
MFLCKGISKLGSHRLEATASLGGKISARFGAYRDASHRGWMFS